MKAKSKSQVRCSRLFIAAATLCACLTLVSIAQAKDKKDKDKAAAAAPEMQAPVKEDFVIGPEDMLAINVWHEQELSRVVPVRPDGKISLPLIGDIEANGHTPKELQASIAKSLEAYIARPEVTVIVTDVKSHKFNVVGEVAKPGSYLLTNPTTVLDAIAAAGGFQTFAKTGKIYVLRNNPNGTSVRLPFNYKQVIKGKNGSQNVYLQSHDTIVVP